LHGSPDALVSPGDANTALRLVANELLTHCTKTDFTGTIRVSALRKALLSRFGVKVWDVMNKWPRKTLLALPRSLRPDLQKHIGFDGDLAAERPIVAGDE